MSFDKVNINFGGGYVSDSGSSEYGKFIVPLTGTYMFIVTICAGNHNQNVRSFLKVNGVTRGDAGTAASAASVGTISTALTLTQGTKVWVESLNTYPYHSTGTSFTGHLIYVEG